VSAKDESLTEAAAAFEQELSRYEHLGEAFVKASLVSTKQLERASQAIDEIAASEERLAQAGRRLIDAVTAARARQEALSRSVLERLPEVRDRHARLRELLGEMAAIGAATGELNERASVIAQQGPEAARHHPAARELAAALDALQARASALADAAREASFVELANQAHALHQRLHSAWKKLDTAVPAPS